MYQSEIYQLLAAPFKAGEIEWRLQTCIEDKMQGLAVPYLQNRAIQNRLDDVLTPAGWKNEYTLWQPNSQLCSIFIRIEYEDGTAEWVGKSDGSSNSDIEPIKGGLSDAMKRAAVHWGIGRYLYDIGSKWVAIEKRGKSFAIVKSEQPKLDEYYNNEVKRIIKDLLSADLIVSNQNLEGNQNFSNKDSRLPSYESSLKSDSFKPMTEFYSEMDSSDETSMSNTPEIYMVSEVKTSTTQYGESTNVKLMGMNDGTVIEAFVKCSADGLSEGMKIKNVKVTLKNGKKRDYYTLDSYEAAA